jgi:hypothetical protein
MRHPNTNRPTLVICADDISRSQRTAKYSALERQKGDLGVEEILYTSTNLGTLELVISHQESNNVIVVIGRLSWLFGGSIPRASKKSTAPQVRQDLMKQPLSFLGLTEKQIIFLNTKEEETPERIALNVKERLHKLSCFESVA